MVFQTVNGPPKGVVKRQSPPLQRWAKSISKVRYETQSPCFVSIIPQQVSIAIEGGVHIDGLFLVAVVLMLVLIRMRS